MSNASSLVVTHPCALIRESLSHFFSRSEFKPIHFTSEFDEDTERRLTSAGDCLWLLGVNEFTASANEAVRKTVAANPSVKVVILAASYSASDLVRGLQAGVRGFLQQDIPSKQLIKSLELVMLGQTVFPPHLAPNALGNGYSTGISSGSLIALPQADEKRLSASNVMPADVGDVAKSLSRRETSILRALTEGASNKIIARKLVITESTVKVHMNAILRKLRMQNRTQAAMWATAHLDELSCPQGAAAAA
jgi:two-component system, NarL family, nitrate/nitrite response regulator NarL